MNPWLPDIPAPPFHPLFLTLDPTALDPTVVAGAKVTLDPTAKGFKTTAVFIAPPLGRPPIDSEIVGCVWHRVILRVEIPRGTRVVLSASTSELPDDPHPDWVEHPAATVTPNNEWDALLRVPPGRYLRLRLALAGAGAHTPKVAQLKVEYPRISLLRYLPAVFSANPDSADLTDRMLAVFDTIFRSVEARLDAFPRYLDPLGTPAGKTTRDDWLGWLGSWMGLSLDRTWTEDRRRRWVLNAWRLYKERGTPRGLRRQLLLFLGWEGDPDDPSSPVLVLEHFRVRRWLLLGSGRLGETADLWGRGLIAADRLGETRLDATRIECPPDSLRNDTADSQAADAHRFTVFVPAPIVRDPAKLAAVNRLVALSAPAHTAYNISVVEPRFRVGVQACVGYDTVIGQYPPAARLPVLALGQGTLVGNPLGGTRPLPTVGKAARIGSSTAITSGPRTESTE
jgi:phage tail-like protein